MLIIDKELKKRRIWRITKLCDFYRNCIPEKRNHLLHGYVFSAKSIILDKDIFTNY